MKAITRVPRADYTDSTGAIWTIQEDGLHHGPLGVAAYIGLYQGEDFFLIEGRVVDAHGNPRGGFLNWMR